MPFALPFKNVRQCRRINYLCTWRKTNKVSKDINIRKNDEVDRSTHFLDVVRHVNNQIIIKTNIEEVLNDDKAIVLQQDKRNDLELLNTHLLIAHH